jgi:hypothetical protein
MANTRSFLVMLSMLVACENQSNTIDADLPVYDTTDGSELFFKNVRSPYYQLEELPEAGIRIFRHRDGAMADSSNTLNVALVMNWRMDKAYMLLEPTGQLRDQDTVDIFFTTDSIANGTLHIAMGNTDDYYAGASRLYRLLKTDSQIFYIDSGGVKLPLFASRDHSEAFRLSVYDFYRLVELL